MFCWSIVPTLTVAAPATSKLIEVSSKAWLAEGVNEPVAKELDVATQTLLLNI